MEDSKGELKKKWSKIGPKSSLKLVVGPNGFEYWTKIGPKWFKNRSKTDSNWSKLVRDWSKTGLKMIQNGPKNDRKQYWSEISQMIFEIVAQKSFKQF